MKKTKYKVDGGYKNQRRTKKKMKESRGINEPAFLFIAFTFNYYSRLDTIDHT